MTVPYMGIELDIVCLINMAEVDFVGAASHQAKQAHAASSLCFIEILISLSVSAYDLRTYDSEVDLLRKVGCFDYCLNGHGLNTWAFIAMSGHQHRILTSLDALLNEVK